MISKKRFSDTTVYAINALYCVSPVTLIGNTGRLPANASLKQLNVLSELYRKELGSKEMVLKGYEKTFTRSLLRGSCDGEAVPRDHEDLLLYLITNYLLDQWIREYSHPTKIISHFVSFTYTR